MPTNHATVNEQVTSEAEQVRRDFARAWGAIGAAWGVAPSTAAVQGYMLLHGGPLTESQVRTALGLSHRAAFTALSECESWGIVEPAESRRTGARGPAGRAWIAVGNHWEWFRRVAAARKERETDPVLPVLEECLRRAEAAGDSDLQDRAATLLTFTHLFDRGVTAVVRSDAAALEHLFGVLGSLPAQDVDRLLKTLASVPAGELVEAASVLAGMRPSVLRRLVALAGRPTLAALLR